MQSSNTPQTSSLLQIQSSSIYLKKWAGFPGISTEHNNKTWHKTLIKAEWGNVVEKGGTKNSLHTELETAPFPLLGVLQISQVRNHKIYGEDFARLL